MARKISPETIRRRAKVAEMLLQGYTQAEIAARLGMEPNYGQKTVCLDAKAIKAQWKESCLRDFNEFKGQQLGKLLLLERHLWQAWEESKKVKTSKKIKEDRGLKKNKAQSEDGEEDQETSTMVVRGIEVEVKKEKREGNPAFSAQIMQCIRDQNELMGIVTKPGETGTAPPIVQFNVVSPPDEVDEEEGNRAESSPEESSEEPADGAGLQEAS